jgi:hypothetical protein
MASQATGLARAVAQFRVEESVQAAALAQDTRDGAAPAHPALGARESRPAVGMRREPVLAAAEQEEWKEF